MLAVTAAAPVELDASAPGLSVGTSDGPDDVGFLLVLIVCVRGGWGLAAGLGAGFDGPLAAAVVGFGGSALDVAGALPLSSVVAAAGGG